MLLLLYFNFSAQLVEPELVSHVCQQVKVTVADQAQYQIDFVIRDPRSDFL